MKYASESSWLLLSLAFLLLCSSSCSITRKLDTTRTEKIQTQVTTLETRTAMDSLLYLGRHTVHLHQVVETYATDSTGNRIVTSRTETEADILDETEEHRGSSSACTTTTEEETDTTIEEERHTDTSVEETAITEVSKGVKIGAIFAIVILSLVIINRINSYRDK